MAITGAEIRNVIESGQTLSISVNRLYGTTYCIGAQYSDEKHAGPVIAPGSDESLKFDSLDEVAAFLMKVGIRSFDVAI
jgi:hypothetical protein